jgi:hypothetical protein
MIVSPLWRYVELSLMPKKAVGYKDRDHAEYFRHPGIDGEILAKRNPQSLLSTCEACRSTLGANEKLGQLDVRVLDRDYLALKITNSVPLCQNLETKYPFKCLPLGVTNSHRSPRVAFKKFLPFGAGCPLMDIFFVICFPSGGEDWSDSLS